ncbi:glutaminase A [Bacteriovorax stolpii]|uniref:Glutaminase n=1 Tax=Bacteriovorax stolpii TaxID=960 RepID=A0A2K9NTP8_BACTC|nr:glutaminase A [Bacteriovorax stolpii]AUN98868.1 glutaminase A [Bacteriovorax stolpii]QDK41137.1 glutaminase A [Bacteriovorax stolpii]TDP55612.1 L-glutaminase [Bacteriovorax stolpii]
MEYMNVFLEELIQKYSSDKKGAQASYIPELAKVNPDYFGIAVVTVDGDVYSAGDIEQNFTLQSASKPFVYGMALEEHGREFIRARVGVEPSGEAFNSIVELEKNTHRPYNPMINSGAIAISSYIQDKDKIKRLERVLNLFGDYVNHPVSVDEAVFQSEKKTAHRNRSIAHLLRHFDVIGDDIEESLDLYFKQCSVLINTVDLATMAATLANNGVQPKSQKQVIKEEYVSDMLSLMFTCGMYDTAGEWAYTVGLPAKSGVSGCILAVVPGKMGIAAYSPLIDQHGHSVRSVNAIKDLVKKYNLSIFKS